MLRYPLSVYVHIPFCDYRCRYCNFTFETGWSPELLQRTLDTLVDEAADEVSRLRTAGLEPAYHTLYIGGGTPGVIPPEKIPPFVDRLGQALDRKQAPWDEAGFEVNPENVTPALLDALADAGFTRLSIGLQTFDTARLKSLGRWCDRETNLRALELIATRWTGTWSGDLMTGLPGGEGIEPQRWVEARDDLNTLLSFHPPHVSLYSLTVEPGTALHSLVARKKFHPPAPAVSDQLWLRAKSTLQQRGYEWYEISNFAMPGHRSLHNPVYWRMDSWLGLGPGAEGNLVARNSQGDWQPLRTRNPRLFPWLTRQPELRDREFVTAPEYLLEHFLTGWRTSDGVSAQRLLQIFRDLPENLVVRLRDDQRLALNAHLEALEPFQGVQFSPKWIGEKV